MSRKNTFWIREMPREKMSETISLSPHGMCAFIRIYWTCFTVQPIADDDNVLARIAGLTVKEWKKVREEVKQHFIVDDSGWFSQDIMDEIVRADEKYAKRAEAGKKGGEATAKKNREVDHVH